ncbi:MAG: hypothetical protein DI538_01540 [Azospira oryzae]|jgi:putative ABC transport system permease protein|nr:MAG: hypothetical protein DI538_01540 [Azospira oryzae]
MIRNYLLITVRNMMKNKVFILINVLGLGVALAVCIVGFLAYEYDATFDAVHQNRETIYRVNAVRQFENSLTHFGYAPLPLGEITASTISDISASSRYVHSGANFKRKEDLFPSQLVYVDADFLSMFSFDFIVGNASALKDKSHVVISEKMAVRLFGTPAAAMGRQLTQVYSTELKEVKIAAVIKDPVANSSFYRSEGTAFMNFENYKDEFDSPEQDWRSETTLFVQIDDASRVAAVHRQLQTYVANNNKVREDFQVKEYALEPFTSMAHHDRTSQVKAATWAAPPLSAIIGSFIMGMMIVLIACFNLTNTAIAISSRRLKEIGIRKVMGSKRVELIIQFIGETTCICFLSLLVGVALADVLVEGWNLMTGNNIHIEAHYTSAFLFFMIGMLFFTGVVAGGYPAFYISKFKPVSILKGRLQLGGTNYFTRTLLGMQFAISLITIVGSIGFFQNARYQRDYDLGFDARGSIVTKVNTKSEFDTYRNALEKNAGIDAIAGARSSIFSNPWHEPVKHEAKQMEVDIIEVGDNYLATMGITLTSGRDFIKDSETDRKESIIITQRMADQFGWTAPLGKEVIWKDSVKLYVVGVIKDVYTNGLWREMEPMMIRYIHPEHYSQLIVSTQEEKVVVVNEYMKQQWNVVFPNRLYNGYMLSNSVQRVNELNMSIVYGYGFIGVIALLLSGIGLFSLLSLNIVKRTKEIGVRKVLGASIFSITRVINMEFIIVVLIASVLGSWASLNWCNIIMSSIWKYYQGVNAITFIIAIATLFAIATTVIGVKVCTLARMNPVKSLKEE